MCLVKNILTNKSSYLFLILYFVSDAQLAVAVHRMVTNRRVKIPSGSWSYYHDPDVPTDSSESEPDCKTPRTPAKNKNNEGSARPTASKKAKVDRPTKKKSAERRQASLRKPDASRMKTRSFKTDKTDSGIEFDFFLFGIKLNYPSHFLPEGDEDEDHAKVAAKIRRSLCTGCNKNLLTKNLVRHQKKCLKVEDSSDDEAIKKSPSQSGVE